MSRLVFHMRDSFPVQGRLPIDLPSTVTKWVDLNLPSKSITAKAYRTNGGPYGMFFFYEIELTSEEELMFLLKFGPDIAIVDITHMTRYGTAR